MRRQCNLLLVVATVLSGLTIIPAALAQSGQPVPRTIPGVLATQPLAYEPGGHAAVFEISRGNETNDTATVAFTLSATATNGVDYLAVPTSVTFAAGQSETNIVIQPVAEPLARGYKTVELQLPSDLGRFFWAGRGSDSAVVYIAYDYTNIAPTIAITRPTNDSSFLSRPNIVISARAADSNGWVTSVEFFANGTSLATVTNQPFLAAPFHPPAGPEKNALLPPIVRTPDENSFMIDWTNVAPGPYTLTAVATDNAGLAATSAPVQITVTTTLPQPAVRIGAPMSGASFPSNAFINIIADAGESGGAIATVEFLAGGKSLGVVTNNPAWEWPSDAFPPRRSGVSKQMPFFIRWTNAPVGSNTLTAIATDNNGTQILSTPVFIDILTNSYLFRHPH